MKYSSSSSFHGKALGRPPRPSTRASRLIASSVHETAPISKSSSRSRLKRRLAGGARSTGGGRQGFGISSNQGSDEPEEEHHTEQFSDDEDDESSNPRERKLAQLPMDRAQGSGWSILSTDESEPDWPVLGCDKESIFLFLHQKNRTSEPPLDRANDRGNTIQRSNSSTSCASEMSWSRASSTMSVLADELAMAAAVC